MIVIVMEMILSHNKTKRGSIMTNISNNQLNNMIEEYGEHVESTMVENQSVVSEYGPNTNNNKLEKLYDQNDEIRALINKYGTKSGAIRALHAQGFTKGAIAKKMNILYQHVFNVLNTNIKKK